MEINDMIGKKKVIESACTLDNTAKKIKSGSLEVFATPAMCALIEQAAAELAEEFLSSDRTSVGTMLNIEHISATPVGIMVRAEAELIEIDGKKLVYKVTAYDEKGEIGRGKHERFIVDREKFILKTNKKLG